MGKLAPLNPVWLNLIGYLAVLHLNSSDNLLNVRLKLGTRVDKISAHDPVPETLIGNLRREYERLQAKNRFNSGKMGVGIDFNEPLLVEIVKSCDAFINALWISPRPHQETKTRTITGSSILVIKSITAKINYVR